MDTYYETHVHDYSARRFAPVIPEIRRLAPDCRSLLDIGCGTGNVLQALASELNISSPVGVESSANLARIARERTGARVIEASVLDPLFPEIVGQAFPIVIMAAVLHHLVANTRGKSLANAHLAVQNAMNTVAPGGILVINEPLFTPRPALAALFYTKLLVSKLTTRRLPLGTYWANIGPPVVSYLTPSQFKPLAPRPELLSIQHTGIPIPLSRFLPGVKRFEAMMILRADEKC